MDKWLQPAIAYGLSWIEHQMEVFDLPGCSLAIAQNGRIVATAAFGSADRSRRSPLTPAHRFRIASHSKTFTAAGIMKLREARRLGLDDRVGDHVAGLDRSVARVTIAQVLAHAAGLTRDGPDSGQFLDRRPYKSRDEIIAELATPQPLPAGLRFKYSNHGFALAGMIIEAVTGEAYGDWMQREVLAPAGLAETTPDMPKSRRFPFAYGHSLRLSDGRRRVIPADMPTRAIAAAGGFVSTPSDVALFFAQLSPNARKSILTPESRRDMVRRYHRDSEAALPWHYGLGTISGPEGDWAWFGHSGSFQGTLSRTVVIPGPELTISVMCNSLDGFANIFVEGLMHICRTFAQRGAPARGLTGWTGRYYGLWGPVDLVPVGDRVMIAAPGTFAPLAGVPEIAAKSPRSGLVLKSSGFGSPGEPVVLERGAKGRVAALRVGGMRLTPRGDFEREVRRRYRTERRA
jgi:D-alanyl-D-alanine carboxypeptidase